MREIVAGLFVSLDGVVESPERWQSPYFNEEMAAEMGAQMARSDALLLGRRTYQEFAAFWPQQGNAGPAAFMNSTPKVVVSTTLDKPEWENTTVINGNAVEELTNLKQQPGKNILVAGSPTLVGSLLRHNVIDELGLMVCPVLLGSGRRLFEASGDQVPMRLVRSKPLSNGVLSATYRPSGA